MKTLNYQQKPLLRPSPAGFTLIEVLIVVSIIAVLVVVSLFASSKFLEKARQTTAINNIRQISVANIAYAQENNGEINVVRVDTETKVERRPGRGYVADSYWGRITPYLFSDISVSSANQPQLAADIKRHLLDFHGTTDLKTMAKTFQRDVKIYGDGSGISVPYAFNTALAPWNTAVRTSTVTDPAQTAYMTYGFYRFTDTDLAEYYPHMNPRASGKRVDYFSDRKAAMIFVDGHLEMLNPPVPKRRFDK
jgi:prepilin-type N-terminal cleavage/methylation domain-containing protein